LGSPGDGDKGALGKCQPGCLQADPRTSTDNDYSLALKLHGNILFIWMKGRLNIQNARQSCRQSTRPAAHARDAFGSKLLARIASIN
jgi:hypothetical protein